MQHPSINDRSGKRFDALLDSVCGLRRAPRNADRAERRRRKPFGRKGLAQ